ncbi:MAG: sigma-70 family RNA polymerase sigma factor [Ruminococcus sp.]|nr:sigma-70 family RNA polymerase sigma factor [Ruminococcus sp.]
MDIMNITLDAQNAQNAQNITAIASEISANTTFSDLLTILGLTAGQKRSGKTPTRAALAVSGGVPVAQESGCKIYENGFALYDNGLGRHTILWLPYCVSFTYHFNKLRDAEKEYLKEKDELPDDLLLSTAWPVVVALFGEERITQNMSRGFGNCDTEESDDDDEEQDDGVESQPSIDTEGARFAWDEQIGANPLDILIRKENREEMLAKMTRKQREAFILYHRYGYTQREIGRMLGVNHRSVGFRLEKAEQAAKNIF